jgi:hypothetical protein
MYGACKARASSAAQPCERAQLQRFTWVCCSWHVRFCMLKQTLVVCQCCIMSAGCTVLPSPTLAESCVNSELTAFLRSNMQWDTASCRDTTGTTLIDDACSAECLPGFVDNGLQTVVTCVDLGIGSPSWGARSNSKTCTGDHLLQQLLHVRAHAEVLGVCLAQHCCIEYGAVQSRFNQSKTCTVH